jgi:CelD/BcsL family acetyltransferase involved in cellulose biosynthesis
MVGTGFRVSTAVTEAAWRAFIQRTRTALVQHTWEWRTVIAADPREHAVYLAAFDDDGQVVGALPSFRFDGEHGALLISVPQPGGYGGVLVDPAHPDAEAITQALLDAFVSEATQQGCLLATIATPPFLADPQQLIAQFAPDFIRENFLQYIDLDGDADALPGAHDARKYHKRAAQARTRYGLRTVFDDDDALFAAWYDVHVDRMTALGVAPLPRPFLDAIRTGVVQRGLGTMCYVLQDGAVVAGCMFVGHHEVLDCFMLSGTPAAARTLATSVLVVDALDWARRRGYRRFNWQSSASRTDGVYAFKAKWGSQEGAHHYLTRITGDITALRRTPLDRIRRAYPWHYVMPYDAFTTHTVSTDA